MNYVTIIGLTAATLTTIAFLPQVLHTWKTKSAKDVSFLMLLSFSSGLFLWLVYGILKKDLAIILANSTTFILNLIIIFMKIKYKK